MTSEPMPQTPAAVPRPAPAERPEPGPRHAPAFFGQVVSGAALLVLLGMHMVAQHFVVPTGLRDYAAVIDWLGSPVVLFLEVAFLVVVTYHAMVGVRAIILDFGFTARAARLITGALWVVGIVTIVYGVALLAAILAAG
jgi:succinate dehydrogenase hydrophobic anchor subunit